MKSVNSFNNSELWKIYHRLFYTSALSRYYKTFFKDIKYPPATRGKILMYVGIGFMYLSPYEILFYHLLRMRGYEVDYLIYDENIPLHELTTKRVVETNGRKKFINRETRLARKTLKAAGIAYRFIRFNENSALFPDEKITLGEIFEFKHGGIDFGNIVKGAVYRYYKSMKPGTGGQEIALNYLKTALTNYDNIKQLISTNKYHCVLFSHGINSTWGPVAEYCRLNDIDYVCYDRAKTAGHINMNFNHPSPVWNLDSAWLRYSGRKLTAGEEERVQKYFEERELQRGDVYSYNFSSREKNLEKVRAKLGIKQGSKVVTLFTNLIWDAANVARDRAFPGMLECVCRTAQYFSDKDEVHVLLRTHPAEKVLGTNESYSELVREYFQGNLPSNFSIADASVDLNSYSVIDISDIGVVNTSTVGLEFAMMEKPVILVSETHYRNKGFTYDVTTESEYFRLLEQLLDKPTLLPDQVTLARKYYYIMMFLYQKKLPLKFVRNVFNGYCSESFLAITEDSFADHILDSIEKKSPDFVVWDLQ